MKKTLLTALVMLIVSNVVSTSAFAQTGPPVFAFGSADAEFLVTTAPVAVQTVAQTSSNIAWDYKDTDAVTGGVTHFEMQMDGGLPKNLGIPTGSPTLDVNVKTYRTPVPPLTPGLHKVGISACNADLCSPYLTLEFKLVVEPAIPANLRIEGGQ